MIFCELRVLHGVKNDVFLVNWFGNGLLRIEPVPSVYILNIQVIVIFFSFIPVEFCCNDIPIVRINALQFFALVIFGVILVFLENCHCLLLVIGDDISVVRVLVVFGERFW